MFEGGYPSTASQFLGHLDSGLVTFDWRQFLGTLGDKPKGTHEKKAAAADPVRSW